MMAHLMHGLEQGEDIGHLWTIGFHYGCSPPSERSRTDFVANER